MFIFPKDIIQARQHRGQQPWDAFLAEMTEAADAMLDVYYPESELGDERSLFRARLFSRAVLTLAGMYIYSEDEKYAKAAWAYIEDAFTWEYWCAEPSVNEVGQPVELDLATGEMGFALANVWTLLEGWMSQEQKQQIIAQCDKRLFKPYLALVDTEDVNVWPWWYMCRMNWNSVSNGGILCIALCLEDIDALAARCIPLALRALDEFADSLHPDGSGEEGIGYWLYGHLYFLYAAISLENATGKKYAPLDKPGMKNTLDFPFDFSPDEAGLSFNDVNWFNPTGGLYVLANRTGEKRKVQALTQRLLDFRKKFDKHPVFLKETAYMWPSEVFALAFCQDAYDPSKIHADMPKVKVYPDNGWGLFTAKDGLRMALRSGSSNVNHGCRDLNAIVVAKNRAVMIENCSNHPYPQGWFGPTRKLFFEDSSAAKSTQLVNGIGQTGYGEAAFVWDENSMTSDATAMYGAFMKKVERRAEVTQEGMKLTDTFAHEGKGDRIIPESRFYTAGTLQQVDQNTWKIERGGETITLQFEANAPLEFRVGQSVPSVPEYDSLNMLRVFVPRGKLTTVITTRIF
nr:hypothetical protein [bacterium]